MTSLSSIRLIPLDRGDIGTRVDRVLLRHLRDVPGVSRTRVQKWIDAGNVLVNGAPAKKPSTRINEGDRLTVRLTGVRERVTMAAEARELDIVYEDEHLLAVNKPAGLIVHPSYKHVSGTLMNALLARVERPSLVHRLDKHTSGLVLVAKTRAVHAALQRAMHAQRIEKDYLAIVWGKVSPARGTIDLALDRDPWDRRRVMVRDKGGQQAITVYERLAFAAGLSLVRCRLVTGRMHQIRVHLAHKGWPIVGDPTYGRPPVEPLPDAALDLRARGFGRQALHAWRLALRHPITLEALELEAPPPRDMRELLEAARLDPDDTRPLRA